MRNAEQILADVAAAGGVRDPEPGNGPALSGARSRALCQLAREFPDRYRELYEAEVRAAGVEGEEQAVTAWMEKSACLRLDARLFVSKVDRPTARHICITHCPVLAQCRRWAHQVRYWPEQVVGGELWVVHSSVHRPAVNQPEPSAKRCPECAPTPPRPHGTPAAARRHRYAHEDLCGQCRESERKRDRDRKRASRSAP